MSLIQVVHGFSIDVRQLESLKLYDGDGHRNNQPKVVFAFKSGKDFTLGFDSPEQASRCYEKLLIETHRNGFFESCKTPWESLTSVFRRVYEWGRPKA